MKTTYKELLDFMTMANNYLRAADEAKEKETPLAFALEDCLDDNKPLVEEYNKQISRLRRRYAEKDKKTTVILKDQYGNMQFTEQAENDLEDAIDELLSQEIQLETNYVSDLPKDLHRRFVKCFTGFVIAPAETPAKQLIDSLPTTKPKNNGR